MHAFVPAQVAELRVGLEANLALEGFHRRVDVCVLFETGTRREGFPALRAGVGTGPDVLGADVPLQDRWVRENPGAVLTREALVLSVYYLVLDEVWSPREGSRAVLALELASLEAVDCHQVLVQTAGTNGHGIRKKFYTNNTLYDDSNRTSMGDNSVP